MGRVQTLKTFIKVKKDLNLGVSGVHRGPGGSGSLFSYRNSLLACSSTLYSGDVGKLSQRNDQGKLRQVTAWSERACLLRAKKYTLTTLKVRLPGALF